MSIGNGFNKEIETYAQQLRDAQTRIKELENELSKVKTQRKELEEVTIPDVMLEQGFTSISLASGAKIDVKPFYFARIPKGPDGETDAARCSKFYLWLDEHGHGSLVKSHFEVYTTDPDEVRLLTMTCKMTEPEIHYELGRGIHWKTLESWFKEQTEKQTQLPTDLFENYVGRKAILK